MNKIAYLDGYMFKAAASQYKYLSRAMPVAEPAVDAVKKKNLIRRVFEYIYSSSPFTREIRKGEYRPYVIKQNKEFADNILWQEQLDKVVGNKWLARQSDMDEADKLFEIAKAEQLAEAAKLPKRSF
jgi:hypothetical protein